MVFKLNASSGQPLYVQLAEQVRHAVELGVLHPGELLPGIRTLAEQLVVSPNTVVKAYSELEHEGIVVMRQGAGAFISERARQRPHSERIRRARERVRLFVHKLQDEGLSEDEIRRLFEAEFRLSTPEIQR
jgi:GntR family transcriptional regulator